MRATGIKKHLAHMLSLFLIISLALIIPTSTATLSANETDHLALLAFKAKIIHDPQGALSSWNLSLHFCNWDGIICSKLRKRVTAINLSSKGLVGSLSPDIGNMSYLNDIILYNNSLQGGIPQQVDRLSRLQVLSLGQNALEGNIPDTLGQLDRLVILELFSNKLSGMIPASVFNLSLLNVFDLADNQLQGSIPSHFGLTLPNLQKIQLSNNRFTGSIPVSLSNASKLQVFDLQFNHFSGPISVDFGRLLYLQKLGLESNNLGLGEQSDLSFLDSLINCSSIKILELGGNNFQGSLPRSVANLSNELTMISLADNKISGSIPSEICKFINLIFLSLEGNQFTGIIPSEIAKLGKLQRVLLSNNRLSGNIPTSIGNLSMLDEMHLENNELNGTIPPSLGHCPMLVLLELSQNNLSGTIPNKLFDISPFAVKLKLSQNHLVGSLPAGIGALKTLVVLDVSENELTGVIPTQLGDCIALDSLYMQGNFIQGNIPQSMEKLRGMQNFDLSRNNLSGKIPDFFETLSLKYLNISWNNLEGEVRMKGVFANASAFSMVGNKGLCGGIPGLQLPRCRSDRSNKHYISSEQLFILIGYIQGLLAFGFFSWLKRTKKESRAEPNRQPSVSFIRLSYQQLHQATNGFSPTNLVSEDCFGLVYKGELGPQYKAIAIKVFNEKSATAFITEREVLQNIHQRNIVKIKGTCSRTVNGHEFKAIIYNYMEQGSLERWLHPSHMTSCDKLNMPQILNLGTKINIAIDVATALDYLHSNSEKPLAHCNLNPSNIWIGTGMSAHVSNFGQAKFITEIGSTRHSSLTELAGTCGYMPPEYYQGSIVSTKGDVYSYGIILLEMLTGKKTTDFMFDETFKLQNFVSNALPDSIRNIIDPVNLHELDRGNAADIENCLSMLFDIGTKCAMEVSQFRPCINDTLTMLKKVRTIYMDPYSVTLSYMDLHKATYGFSSANIVGAGGFGSVYKGICNEKYFSPLLRISGMEDAIGTAIAIKVFDLERRGAVRRFNTEYKILRNIHHPNLIKMITTCTSVDQEGHDFRAILYEFMDHGSLEMWLHPTQKKLCDGLIKRQTLSLHARINIAIDVACALNYLHQGIYCTIHCDLKPGNILLDKNMVAHIADFGSAISLPESLNFNQSSRLTGMRGTTGYIAPEYGLGCQMTTKGDAYSYGILLLEMLTGKKPTHLIFRGGINLHNFVSLALPNDVISITDPLMTSVKQGDGKRVEECLTRMFQIGLACSNPSPKDRPDMRAVLHELKSIRNNFQINAGSTETYAKKSSLNAVLTAQGNMKYILTKKMAPDSSTTSMLASVTVSYMDLHKATNGLCITHLVGAGGYGSVYRGTFHQEHGRLLLRDSGIEDETGTTVAIKVFNLQRRGSAKSFKTEYETLRNIHHPNLVKIITTCTSVDQEGHDFRAIVYEFMDHGSLAMWLHPTNKAYHDRPIEPRSLSLHARINIATDVACALSYLHHQCENCIIHCDLKPSNILLDENMVARISDFGLAASLSEFPSLNKNSSLTGIRGTVGYIAPEYGLGCKMTTKGDIYSFGILLLEMLTSKKPTHRMFQGGLNLHSFVWMSLPDNVIHITDPLMKATTSVNEGNGKQVEECLTRMFNVGLACSNPSSKDRPDMRAVLRELESIRNNFWATN